MFHILILIFVLKLFRDVAVLYIPRKFAQITVSSISSFLNHTLLFCLLDYILFEGSRYGYFHEINRNPPGLVVQSHYFKYFYH